MALASDLVYQKFNQKKSLFRQHPVKLSKRTLQNIFNILLRSIFIFTVAATVLNFKAVTWVLIRTKCPIKTATKYQLFFAFLNDN